MITPPRTKTDGWDRVLARHPSTSVSVLPFSVFPRPSSQANQPTSRRPGSSGVRTQKCTTQEPGRTESGVAEPPEGDGGKNLGERGKKKKKKRSPPLNRQQQQHDHHHHHDRHHQQIVNDPRPCRREQRTVDGAGVEIFSSAREAIRELLIFRSRTPSQTPGDILRCVAGRGVVDHPRQNTHTRLLFLFFIFFITVGVDHRNQQRRAE